MRTEKVVNQMIDWMQDWEQQNGKGCNFVVGVSGGTDSSVVASLAVKAFGADRVIGVLIPNGTQSDILFAKELTEFLGIKNITINIGDAYACLLNELNGEMAKTIGLADETSVQTETNLPARLRMSTLYAVAQSNNGRVINTCNLSEDWVGYSTRYGDSVGDLSPLAHITKTEVRMIGEHLGLPSKFVDKTPSDGLCGRTDEENLGFTYAVLDKYIRTGEIDDQTTKEKIDIMHEKNLFKLEIMPSFVPLADDIFT